ncbi:hypothetical protein LTR15_004722 [Elasticomyces elasticus]|nr:hypothetical protein LTR15_004722 [Elasticomyces elasticus]
MWLAAASSAVSHTLGNYLLPSGSVTSFTSSINSTYTRIGFVAIQSPPEPQIECAAADYVQNNNTFNNFQHQQQDGMPSIGQAPPSLTSETGCDLDELVVELTKRYEDSSEASPFSRIFHITAAQLEDELPGLLNIKTRNSTVFEWYQDQICYEYSSARETYMLKPAPTTRRKEMAAFVETTVGHVIRSLVLELRMHEPGPSKAQLYRVVRSIRSKGTGSGMVTVDGDERFPSQVWAARGECPVILEVFYHGEFAPDVQAQLVNDALDSDVNIRTVVTIELPFPANPNDDKAASVTCFSSNSPPKSVQFRKSDGSRGDGTFYLTLSQFLPSGALVSFGLPDRKIEFSLHVMFEVLEVAEKQYQSTLSQIKETYDEYYDGEELSVEDIRADEDRMHAQDEKEKRERDAAASSVEEFRCSRCRLLQLAIMMLMATMRTKISTSGPKGIRARFVSCLVGFLISTPSEAHSLRIWNRVQPG